MSAQEETTTITPVTPASDTTTVANTAAPEQGTSPEQQSVERDEKGKFRNPLQPRIDELTRARREAERESAYWRQRAEAKETPAPAAPEKPTPDKFENYNDYVEALAEFKADEKVAKALEAREAKDAEKQTAETRKSTWNERATKTIERIPDYDEVMSTSDVPVAQHVLDILQDPSTELGPDVAYHLAKNPDVADKLNRMTPAQAAREIGKLEVALGTVSAKPEPAADAPQEPVTPARRTTNAPPPVKPVAQARSGSLPLEKMSMDDYVKARKAQGASWAR